MRLLSPDSYLSNDSEYYASKYVLNVLAHSQGPVITLSIIFTLPASYTPCESGFHVKSHFTLVIYIYIYTPVKFGLTLVHHTGIQSWYYTGKHPISHGYTFPFHTGASYRLFFLENLIGKKERTQKPHLSKKYKLTIVTISDFLLQIIKSNSNNL